MGWTNEHREKSLKTRRCVSASRALQKGSGASNRYLKSLLLEVHDKDYCCESCGNRGDWNGAPLELCLDHINGDSFDNRMDNLRFLCPNCHSQTDTFCGKKNKGKQKVSSERLIEALKSSKNIRQALISVGLTPKGLNYNRAYKLLAQLGK